MGLITSWILGIIIILGITKRVIIIVFIDKENISFDDNLIT
jgi:hypothetical protein